MRCKYMRGKDKIVIMHDRCNGNESQRSGGGFLEARRAREWSLQGRSRRGKMPGREKEGAIGTREASGRNTERVPVLAAWGPIGAQIRGSCSIDRRR